MMNGIMGVVSSMRDGERIVLERDNGRAQVHVTITVAPSDMLKAIDGAEAAGVLTEAEAETKRASIGRMYARSLTWDTDVMARSLTPHLLGQDIDEMIDELRNVAGTQPNAHG